MDTGRIAGFFYLLTFVTGIAALVVRGSVGAAAGLAAAACYLAVTVLFYFLFRPVSKTVSLVAACISLAGIAVGPLRVPGVHPLAFFGVYCLLIGYLVYRSGFLPRALGVLMACSALGWLMYISPSFGQSLYPYNLAPGIIGEGSLTVWLLARGASPSDRTRL